MHYVFQKFLIGKNCYQTEEDTFVTHSTGVSYNNNGGHAILDDSDGIEQAIESEERREADVR